MSKKPTKNTNTKSPKRKKKPKIHSDKYGQFVWETYLVGGKQKRQKIRTINDIDFDSSTWMLANADDIFLHHDEHDDLIHQREPADDIAHPEAPTPKPTMRSVPLNIFEVEDAFESVSVNQIDFSSNFMEPTEIPIIDLRTGEIVFAPEEDHEWPDESDFFKIDEPLTNDLDDTDLEQFIETLEDEEVRSQLNKTIQGRRAFHKFKVSVIGRGSAELKHAWRWFNTRRHRQHIVEWLELNRIAPQWHCDIFEPPPLPSKRLELLQAILSFTKKFGGTPGVRRISLLGSLTTEKHTPEGIELLIEIEDTADLKRLARAKQELTRAVMATGGKAGATAFLCNAERTYLGRCCSRKSCERGNHQSCEAQHCGRRPFLHDDLHLASLEHHLLEAPPLDLWPKIIIRTELPKEVLNGLVEPLRRCGKSRQRLGNSFSAPASPGTHRSGLEGVQGEEGAGGEGRCEDGEGK